jgi:two-component system, cell cycle sensor histidine kinase and response regulator CckA
LLDTAQPLALLDQVGEGIFALDSDWRFAYMNRQAERVLSRISGSPPYILLGTIIWDYSALADSILGRALHRAYVEQTPVVHEVPYTDEGDSLEVRVYPADGGFTVLLRENMLPGLTCQLLDGMGEAFIGCDHEWRVTHLNARAEAYLSPHGLGRSRLLGKNIWYALPRLAGSRLQAEAFRAHAQGTPVELQEFIPATGRWFAIRMTPTSQGLVAYASEVPDRSEAEHALQASEQRFRRLIEAIDDVVFRLDQDQRCVDAFGRWLEREGIEPAILIGRTVREIVGPENASVHEHANQRALSGETITYEWNLQTPRGNCHMQTTLSPLHGAGGEVVGIVGVGRDVTQRIESGRELQRWARIFEHAGWGVAIITGEGTIESLNPAFAAMHGWTVDELRGSPMAVLAPPGRHEFPRMNPAYDDRGHQVWETERMRRNGQVFPAMIDATAIRNVDGQVIYYAVNVQDLTERRRAEEQVRQAQKMEAVGRLAGGVAHDFNNMMMIIMGFSDFLLTTLERADPRWSDAEEIRKAADRAMHLTRQLLGFGRQQLVARTVLSLNEVISGMERMLRPLLGEDIRLATYLSVALGGVEADYGQLEQVVMNLALNARDAMRGGGRLTIETLDVDLPEGYAYRQIGIDIPMGPYVMLVVSDTGEGMSAEVKARLFEPFFTTKPATQNTGLGLTTVYGIVVQSGGYIWVDSEPGKGTSFKICFPRVDSEEATPIPPRSTSEPAKGSETILLVEDEETVRTVASRVLTGRGYVVHKASNGEEALALARGLTNTVDLVLTDVVMPDMGGVELVGRLMALWPGLKVVYMSGYAQGDKLEGSGGAVEGWFLQKPFSTENLTLKVREVLDGVPEGSGRGS